MYALDELTVEQKVELELILKAGYKPEQARKATMFLLGSLEEYTKRNSEIEVITGNFENALNSLIMNIQENKLSSSELLYRWDRARGIDWFTSTRLAESKIK